MKNKILSGLIISLCLIVLSGCEKSQMPINKENSSSYVEVVRTEILEKEEKEIVNNTRYNGEPYIVENNNVPYFTEEELTTETFEYYSDLDDLGRCGVAYACLSPETEPPEGASRGSIGMVKPSGWHTIKYPEVINDLYLYNRCHLIGWQLGNENANELNLITGTRYLNIEGMLPFENQVDDYIDSTGNHVMYRVTPKYTGDNLVADGVLMEAKSVEDDGCIFCVWCPNVQPGIEIDYTTGDSWLKGDVLLIGESLVGDESEDKKVEIRESDIEGKFIINTNTKKIHTESCRYIKDIKEENKEEIVGKLSEIVEKGYIVCKVCNPA